MNKISSFTVTAITMQGFKNFAEPQSFTFGGMNSITGHNGKGKTTVAEAIAYAITGVPLFGEASLDRLYTLEQQRDLRVELTLDTPDGTHTLIRARRNDETTVTYDGITLRQSDLAVMFGEKDVFLSIFNPLYFIEVLGDKGRNLLERYLPAIPQETVLARLSEPTRALLANEQLNAPEAYLERVRAELRELENSVIYTEGQRDMLGAQGIEAHAALTQKQAELAETEAAYSALHSKMIDGLDYAEMNGRREDLYARYDETRRDARGEATALDDELLKVTRALETRRAESCESKLAAQLSETAAAFENAKKRYARESAVLKGIKPGIVCPSCKQAVTERNLETVKQSFVDSVNAVMEEGRVLRDKLGELRELDEKSRAVFEDFKRDDISKYETRLTELNAQRESARGGGSEEALAQIKAQIQSLEADIKFGNLAPDEYEKLEALQKDGERLRAELEALASVQLGTVDDKEQELSQLRAAVTAKKELETAVKFYLEERAGLLFSDFDMLNRVKIILYDAVKKTGEAKSVFKFSYDGRPYKFLSLSEKIKAGLEISELMKKLTDSDYPVFIDNGESVPVIDNVRPTGQVFIAQVVKGAPLNVKILDAPQSAAA